MIKMITITTMTTLRKNRINLETTPITSHPFALQITITNPLTIILYNRNLLFPIFNQLLSLSSGQPLKPQGRRVWQSPYLGIGQFALMCEREREDRQTEGEREWYKRDRQTVRDEREREREFEREGGGKVWERHRLTMREIEWMSEWDNGNDHNNGSCNKNNKSKDSDNDKKNKYEIKHINMIWF